LRERGKQLHNFALAGDTLLLIDIQRLWTLKLAQGLAQPPTGLKQELESTAHGRTDASMVPEPGFQDPSDAMSASQSASIGTVQSGDVSSCLCKRYATRRLLFKLGNDLRA